MPTRTDITVIASSADFGRNTGRKSVLLKNGWLVAGTYATNVLTFEVSKDNGATWQILTKTGGSGEGVSNQYHLQAVGNRVVAFAFSSPSGNVFCYNFDATTVGAQVGFIGGGLGQGEYDVNGISAVVNDALTEIHLTWGSKGSNNFTGSYNILYRKGLINPDWTITWGSIVYVTSYDISYNSRYNLYSPTIILDANGVPTITATTGGVCPFSGGADSFGILIFKNDKTLNANGSYMNSAWSAAWVYSSGGTTYFQANSQAIFIPKSINGLANGRIWVAWDGTEATAPYNNFNQIRVSYSDDNGKTWAAMQRITDANGDAVTGSSKYNASITANKANEIFVLYQGKSDSSDSYEDIRYKKFSNGSWGSEQVISVGTLGHKTLPSALFDLTINPSVPLFIYKDAATKVGFYGTWAIITISVTPGYLGTKTDRSNILTYAITSDMAMGAIVEQVNGVKVGSKSVSSGANTTVSATQTQWDEVTYGNVLMPNLLPKFSEWIKHANFTVTDDYAGTLNATGAYQDSYVILPCDPSTTYYLRSLLATTYQYGYTIWFLDANQTYISSANGGSLIGDGSFTTPANCKFMRVIMTSSVNGTFNFGQPMLVKGSAKQKFAPNDISVNTLTISMGAEKWTFTFTKQLSANDDFTTTLKAAQDAQNVFLPLTKAKLAAAIRSKGGTANDSDTFDTMIAALAAMTSRKFASGKGGVVSGSTVTFYDDGGSASYMYSFTVTGLSFTPSMIFLLADNGYSGVIVTPITIGSKSRILKFIAGSNSGYYDDNADLYQLTGAATISNGGFTIPNYPGTTNSNWNWFAIE